MPFSGFAGLLIVSLMAVGAVLVYVALFCYQHFVTGSDERPVKVFAFDLSKILISQSGAWVVNLGMTQLVVQRAAAALGLQESRSIQGIAWYASIFLMDCLVGVPLGIVLGKLLNRWCRWILQDVSSQLSNNVPGVEECRRSRSSIDLDVAAFVADLDERDPTCLERFCAMNAQYGKYGPHHGEQDYDSELAEASLRCSWWASQLASWTLCVSLSRVLSGLIVLVSFDLLRNSDNIVLEVAVGITEWKTSCAKKQWVVAGAMRIALDLGQIAIIDLFNRLQTHYRSSYHRL